MAILNYLLKFDIIAGGSRIESVHARQIFDSRGNPTVEVDLKTDKGKLIYV